ncbi:hypothetical protein MLD38_012806 [Melastoma candidum]|uniref:Uncharacterized protein n=1 Tax=Melastoma candidum TaxID=119954 RepID=A0ACB9R7H8_9MYRT|nr:hypothetical protein MLD38_012806 [Melastoma candidum]
MTTNQENSNKDETPSLYMDHPPLHGVPAEAQEIAPVKEVDLPSVADINLVQDHQYHAVGPPSAGRSRRYKSKLKRRNSGARRKSTVGGWTEEEDAKLEEAVRQNNGKNWKMIATNLPGRTDVQCLHRWQKVLDPNLIKGPWTKEEDNLIVQLVEQHGEKHWALIAKSLPGRIGKQCRERWNNYLKPGIVRTPWTEQEDLILIEAHGQYGNKWAELTKLLPGRSENAIKNHWNCTLSKRVNRQNDGRRRPATEPSNSGSSGLKDSEEVAQPQVIVVGDINYLSSFGATHQAANIAIHEPNTESNSRECLSKGAEVTVPVEEYSSSPRRDSFEAPKWPETAPIDSFSGLSLNFASGAITEGSALVPTPRLHNIGLSPQVSCPESLPKSAPEMFPGIPPITRTHRLQDATTVSAADNNKDSSGCMTMQVSGSSPTLSKKRVTVSSIMLFGTRLECDLDIAADAASANSNYNYSSGIDLI